MSDVTDTLEAGSPDASPADDDAPESASSTATTMPAAATDGFTALGLDPRLVAALGALGYEEPTPIQREAIPPLIAGRDLLGQAATGTGKTAAFALPLLQRTAGEGGYGGEGAARPVRALVLVPTRELAMQVAEAIHKYGKPYRTRVLAVYGGQAIQQQLRALQRGVDVIVATPGRALDHIGRGSLDLAGVSYVVLDEADEMLDMGFAEDLDAILEALPAERQTALLSATLPPRVRAIAERHLKEPERITIAGERSAPGEVPRVRQTAYVVQRRHKVPALGRVLDMESPTSAIVFCRTRTEVDELTETLAGRGYRAEALHGGMSQEQRDRVMRRFRDAAVELLIATDVAARGLDVEHVSHVVNFDVPSAPDAYVHRIGRTGRAGREGVAITLAEPRELRLLRNIEHVTKQKIPVESVPTAVDLRTRRLELTRAALRETLLAGNLDGYRAVVESLAEEFDVMDIASAAVRLAHEEEGAGAGEEEDIPSVTPGRRDDAHASRGRDSFKARQRSGPQRDDRPERSGRFERSDRPDRSERPRRPAFPREEGDAGSGGGERAERSERPERGERLERPGRERAAPGGRRERPQGRTVVDSTRLYIGIGRKHGLRPADVVGAIANEAGIPVRDIGQIEIADRFSLVEIPGDSAEEVIGALRATTIRGKKVVVRRDKE